MGTRYEMIRTDDIDGSTKDIEQVEIVAFGETIALDLNKRHRAELKRKLQPYIDAAHNAQTKARIRATSKAPEGKAPSIAHEVRQWALGRGMEVPPRGRIPKAITEKYEEYQSNLSHVG